MYNKNSLNVKTVSVVGANGTMGRNISAIFASFGNAKVYMVSRSLEKSKQAIETAYQSVRAESVKNNMIPADYSMLKQCVEESDIVFESSAEDWKIKQTITEKIADAAKENLEACSNTIFCTGTSGLSIEKLANILPEEIRSNYMGMHMFNPPYTMTLCEMTATPFVNRELFETAMEYCKKELYRTVVEVKDAPAFLGNRIGFQFINEALQFAEKYKYHGGIDYMDAILGPFTGRNMAPLATADFVGLDVHKAIVDNIYDNTNDFSHKTFLFPEFGQRLIKEGKLGRKAKEGLYKIIKHDSGVKIRQVYDIETGMYRNVINYTFPFVEAMLNKLKNGDYEEAFQILKTNQSLEAEICCSFLLKYILYSLEAVRLVAYNIDSADDVMATGFNWCPPLALIEAFGGIDEVEKLCRQKIDPNYLSGIDICSLKQYVKPSKYDFRKFIKAKK